MGYTHYMRRPKELDPKIWRAFWRDAILIMIEPEVLPLLCDDSDDDPLEPPPRLWEDRIWFNGRGANEHETFVIEQQSSRDPDDRFVKLGEPRGLIFEFCKTACKPYDIAVTAILIALKAHYGSAVIVSSDGGWKEDWAPGRALYERVLNKTAVRPWLEDD